MYGDPYERTLRIYVVCLRQDCTRRCMVILIEVYWAFGSKVSMYGDPYGRALDVKFNENIMILVIESAQAGWTDSVLNGLIVR